MIYDLRTFDLRPHATPDVERRLGEAYEERKRLSALAASFHSEIGPLNQVIQIWPYESIADQQRITGAAANIWPPDLGDHVIAETSEIFIPLQVSPAIAPGTIGPFFEMRRYTYSDGDLPNIERAWERALPLRLEFGPIVGVWHSDSTNTLIHIWPYESLDARMEIRRKVRDTGLWPPLAYARKHGLPGYRLVRMQNSILMPAVFSPLQ